jgi:hypothetical protein
MTYADFVQYLTDKFARPNDTYMTQVVPWLINKCIAQIERTWDWNAQYYEFPCTVTTGNKEIVFSLAGATFKKPVGDLIYDLTNMRGVQYKKFFPGIVLGSGDPYWYTVSPDKRIYLSALAVANTSYIMPMRVMYSPSSTHWLFTEYPFELADFVLAYMKKDSNLQEGLNAIKLEFGNMQALNHAEMKITPNISQFLFGIRRELGFEIGGVV